jgi:hypothetical protein
MTFWQALVIGIIQGLTEFIPISSSAHMVFAARLTHLFQDLDAQARAEQTTAVMAVTQLGTLAAVFVYFARDIWNISNAFIRDHLALIGIENGDVLTFDNEGCYITGHYDTGRTFIDESGYKEISGELVRERKQIAFDGIVTAVVTVDSAKGTLETVPEIVARGVLGLNGDEKSGLIIKELQRLIAGTYESSSNTERRDAETMNEKIRLEVRRYIQRETGAKPVVMPVIVAV